MTERYWIHVAELAFAFLLALVVYFSWRACRRTRRDKATSVSRRRTATRPRRPARTNSRHTRSRETHHRDARANCPRAPEPNFPPIAHRSAIRTSSVKLSLAPSQCRHSRRRPKASLRLHHRLQSLPGKARRRPGRPHRRTQENHRTHPRTRRRSAHRPRRQRLAPHRPCRQMVPHRRRGRSRCRQNRSLTRLLANLTHS